MPAGVSTLAAQATKPPAKTAGKPAAPVAKPAAAPAPEEQSAAAASPDTVKLAGDSLRAASDLPNDRVEAAQSTALHGTPDGNAFGTLQSGAPARILGRTKGWTRVQVEGWVRDTDVRPSSAAALTGVTAAEVRAKPDAYIGQTVDWRLQLIAVQVADELRPEMVSGQPYLLVRGPLPEAGFVYVTLSKAQADQMRALPPLEEMVLRVNIRTARTRYLDTPVVDLVAVLQGGTATRRP